MTIKGFIGTTLIDFPGHIASSVFTSGCRFRCPYCYVTGRKWEGQELNVAEIEDAVLQAKDLGARRVIVLGGEPMLFPHLRDMVRFIRSRGLAMEMFTNGTHMTQEMARFLADSGVKVVLKMNTYRKELQDRLAGVEGAY